MTEEAVLFGPRQSLAGIITEPAIRGDLCTRTAVVLLNAGIVHRVGPGRIYVKMARALAAMGFVALRFDFSGIGDSAVRHDHLSFEKSAVAEAQEAIEFLKATRGIDRFLFLGGCSGAFASLEAACCDPRVTGAVLINFQTADDDNAVARPDSSTRKAAHYYWSCALFNLTSWSKLLTGKTDYGQLIRVLWLEARRRLTFKKNELREPTDLETSLGRVAARRVPLVFVCSGGDPRLQDLREAGGQVLKRLCASGEVVLDIIHGADHTFSSIDDQQHLLKTVCRRIESMQYLPTVRHGLATGAEVAASSQLLQPAPVAQVGTNARQGRDL
jgi:alpha/beta superfamily hydrolase